MARPHQFPLDQHCTSDPCQGEVVLGEEGAAKGTVLA